METLLPRRWWLFLFGGGVLVGQVAAYAWGEPGGGSSIGICGLAGGALVVLLVQSWREPVTWLLVIPVVGYVAALAGWGGAPFAAVSCTLAVVSYAALGTIRQVNVDLVVLAVAVVVAIGMAAVADLHGVSLLAGILLAVIAWRPGRPGVRRDRELVG